MVNMIINVEIREYFTSVVKCMYQMMITRTNPKVPALHIHSGCFSVYALSSSNVVQFPPRRWVTGVLPTMMGPYAMLRILKQFHSIFLPQKMV